MGYPMVWYIDWSMWAISRTQLYPISRILGSMFLVKFWYEDISSDGYPT